MTNKNVEELIREHYALRHCDYVGVEFMCMCNKYEDYTVTDVIDYGSHEVVRKSRVLVEVGQAKLKKVELIEEYSV